MSIIKKVKHAAQVARYIPESFGEVVSNAAKRSMKKVKNKLGKAIDLSQGFPDKNVEQRKKELRNDYLKRQYNLKNK